MTRVYIIKREYVCELVGQVCDYIGKPNCKICETYIEYKKSGQTIKQFGEENRIK